MIVLCACGTKSPTWQDQYDLGVRYLSEGNYEEAIIAFTAAIEIDPKQAPTYVGRGDAYIGSGKTEENLMAAQVDYEKAIELGVTDAEIYLKLANVYLTRGNYESAYDLLKKGYENTRSEQIKDYKESLYLENDGFCSASSFIPYAAMDETDQKMISELYLLFLDENTEGIDRLLSDYTKTDKVIEKIEKNEEKNKYRSLWIQTLYNGNKIRVEWTDTYIRVEQRPRNGKGYYYYHDERETDYATGICEQWNWNGAFEHTSITPVISPYGSTMKRQCIGTVVDGLVHGDLYVKDVIGTKVFSEGYYTFSNGKLLGFWEGDSYVIGYSVNENGGKTHITGDYKAFKDWYCNYKTGMGSIGIDGTYNLLWD